MSPFERFRINKVSKKSPPRHHDELITARELILGIWSPSNCFDPEGLEEFEVRYPTPESLINEDYARIYLATENTSSKIAGAIHAHAFGPRELAYQSSTSLITEKPEFGIDRHFHLSWLSVAAEYRRQDLPTLLFKRFLRDVKLYVKERNLPDIDITLFLQQNDRLEEFTERCQQLGFEVLGSMGEIYQDLLLMRSKLSVCLSRLSDQTTIVTKIQDLQLAAQ